MDLFLCFHPFLPPSFSLLLPPPPPTHPHTHTHKHSLQMLHLYAVDNALRSLETPLGKKETEDKEKATLTQWLNKLRLSQNAVDSILSLPSQSELTKSGRCVYVCESGMRVRGYCILVTAHLLTGQLDYKPVGPI